MIFWIQQPRMKAMRGVSHKMFVIDGLWWIFRMGSGTRHNLLDRRSCRWWKPWIRGKVWSVWRVEGHCERAEGGPWAIVLGGGRERKMQMY